MLGEIKVEYTHEYDSENGICIVCVTGVFSRPVDSDIMKEFALDFFNEHNCHRFLFDLTKAEVLGETMQLYAAANPDEKKFSTLRKLRTAFVRRELTDDDYFFETVAVNRGFTHRGFDTVEKAMEWLLQDSE